MRPAQALDAAALLAEVMTLDSPSVYLAYMHGMRNGGRTSAPEHLAANIRRHLGDSDVYHLDQRMAQAVEDRAAALATTLTLADDAAAPPSICGVLALEQPWMMVMSDGTVKVNLLTWGPAPVIDARTGRERVGVLVTLWQHRDHVKDDGVALIMADPDVAQLQHEWAPLMPLTVDAAPLDTPLGSLWRPVEKVDAARLRLRGQRPNERINSMWHYVVATWALMAESRTKPDALADLGEEPVHRSSIRRARRAGIEPRVTVVTLRRTEGPTATGTGTPLTHRVPVKEHRRHYWINDPDNPGQKIRVERSIRPHWRGPENAPVRVSDKVYTLKH